MVQLALVVHRKYKYEKSLRIGLRGLIMALQKYEVPVDGQRFVTQCLKQIVWSK